MVKEFGKRVIFCVLFFLSVLAFIFMILPILGFFKTKPVNLMIPVSVYQQPKDAELRKVFEAALVPAMVEPEKK